MKQYRTPRQSPESVPSSFVQQATSGAGQSLPPALRNTLEPSFEEHNPFSGKNVEKSGDRLLKMAGVNQ